MEKIDNIELRVKRLEDMHKGAFIIIGLVALFLIIKPKI